MTLYGRDSALKAIRSTPSGVLIIEGDSGVGKSAVIAALKTGWKRKDHVPGARQLGATRGSLQAAIVDQLAEVLDKHMFEHPELVKSAWKSLTAVLDQMISATSVEAGKIILASIHGVIEKRVGRQSADAASAAIMKAILPIGSSVSDRLLNLTAPDLATPLLSVADEVASICVGRLVLRLDAAETLHPDDLALLSELAERSVPSLVIVAGFSTVTPSSLSSLAGLEARGAGRLALEALDPLGLQSWFAAESVPRDQWRSIAKLSSGYPFFVDDAIKLVKAGEPLDKLSTPNAFESLLKLAWNALPLPLKPLAMKLSAFIEPPDESYILTVLSLPQLEWSTMREALLSSNVFVSRPDGEVWFHDRRRNFIWNALMTAKDRAAASDELLPTLRSWQAAQKYVDPWMVESLPELMRGAKGEVVPGQYLGNLYGLNSDGLTVLFALVELIEQSGDLGMYASTPEVVSYALARFGQPDDPVATLEELHRLDLVVSSTNEHVSIIGLKLPDPLAYPALIAWIADHLGKMPRRGFASATFASIIRPHMAGFTSAVTGIGDGTLREHRASLESIKSSEKPTRPLRQIPALGVVALVDGQAITSTVSFKSPADRDAAISRLNEYESSRQSHEAAVVRLVTLPPKKLRGHRLVGIAKQLDEYESTIDLSSSDKVTRWAESRVQIAEIARKHLSDIEASAFGTTEPRSMLLEVRGAQAWAEFEVTHSKSAELREVVLVDPKDALNDPLLALKFQRDGFLKPGERITRTTVRSRSKGPEKSALRDVADHFASRARSFNSYLDNERFPADEVALEEAIQGEQTIRRQLVMDLQAAGLVKNPSIKLDDSIHVLLHFIDEKYGSRWHADAYTVADGLGRVIVRVGQTPLERDGWKPSKASAELLEISDVDAIASQSIGDANYTFSEMLGYEPYDFQIERPRRA